MPWEESVVAKVGKKIFVFFGPADEPRVDLGQAARFGRPRAGLDGATPTSYGLGRHGWVTVPVSGDEPPRAAEDWVEESYRAIATKRLIAELDARV